MRQTPIATATPYGLTGRRRLLRACVAVLALVAPVYGLAQPAPEPSPAQVEPAAGTGEGGPPIAIVKETAPPDPAAAPSPGDDRALPSGGVGDRVVKTAVTAIPAPRGKGIDRAFVEEVFAEICRLGIREPQIVMRQAILETGWLRAPFLMKRNNLFGFRYRSYLTFDDWRDSVRYYRDWQARRYKASDPSYYAFLTRIRYGAPNYLDHLRKIRWERECAPAPSPLMPEPPAVPAAPPAQTLAHPDLPAQVEAIVPPLLKEGADAAALPAAPAPAATPAPR